ncbi:MAG TPA: hypothetical protein O0X14_01990, partial [Methanocorpusculum sp.]|nr:hypothetical protein [Methanocorpusculum sp.]
MKLNDYLFRNYCESNDKSFEVTAVFNNGEQSLSLTVNAEDILSFEIQQGVTSAAPIGNYNYDTGTLKFKATTYPDILKTYGDSSLSLSLTLTPTLATLSADEVEFKVYQVTDVTYIDYVLSYNATHNYEITVTFEDGLHKKLQAQNQLFKIINPNTGIAVKDTISFESGNTETFFLFNQVPKPWTTTKQILVRYFDEQGQTISATDTITVYNDSSSADVQVLLLVPKHIAGYYKDFSDDEANQLMGGIVFTSADSEIDVTYKTIDTTDFPYNQPLTIGQYVTTAYAYNLGVHTVNGLWNYVRYAPITNIDDVIGNLKLAPCGLYDWNSELGKENNSLTLQDFLVSFAEYIYCDIYATLNTITVGSITYESNQLKYRNPTLQELEEWNNGEFVYLTEKKTDWIESSVVQTVDTLSYPNIISDGVGLEFEDLSILGGIKIKSNLNNARLCTNVLYNRPDTYLATKFYPTFTHGNNIAEYLTDLTENIASNPTQLFTFAASLDGYPCLEIGDKIALQFNESRSYNPIMLNGRTIKFDGAYSETIEQEFYNDTFSQTSASASALSQPEVEIVTDKKLKNYYTKAYIDNLRTDYKAFDYSDWIWVDCVDGSDTTGDGTQANPYKTYDYAFEQFEKLNNTCCPSFELMGNPYSTDTTTRLYTLSAHNLEKLNKSISESVVFSGIGAWHMHSRGHGVTVKITGKGLKKIYGGHINWNTQTHPDSNERGVMTFTQDTDDTGTIYEGTGHSLYFGFEQCNITIDGVDFLVPIWCNGVEGSFKGCAFKNLIANYSRIQFVSGALRNDTLIIGQRNPFDGTGCASYAKIAPIDFRNCPSIRARTRFRFRRPNSQQCAYNTFMIAALNIDYFAIVSDDDSTGAEGLTYESQTVDLVPNTTYRYHHGIRATGCNCYFSNAVYARLQTVSYALVQYSDNNSGTPVSVQANITAGEVLGLPRFYKTAVKNTTDDYTDPTALNGQYSICNSTSNNMMCCPGFVNGDATQLQLYITLPGIIDPSAT